jgi:N-acetylgalactosamine-6-sulfatase
VTSFIDWMPTLCAIAGIDERPEQLDGDDVSDIWCGADRERSKPLFWRTSSTGAAPAMREGRWKLHLGSRKGKEMELYDLSVDPSERRNVTEMHPDVVARMKAKLEAWVAELPREYQKARDKKKVKQERAK